MTIVGFRSKNVPLSPERNDGGAEVALLLNLNLTTLGRYLRRYYERRKELLPMKGYVLDQGSNPTHKGIIIEMYEQAVSPADIVLKTGHTQEAVDRYIKGLHSIPSTCSEH